MTRLLLALGAVASFATAALAQPGPRPGVTPPGTSDDPCKAAVDARKIPSDGHDHCTILANDVAKSLLHAARQATKRVDPGVNPNQPSITDTPGAQVSAGQTAAVASGQPVGSAGGTVAALGATGQGLQLVTALAINPGTIATGDTDTHTVWLSRFADLSVVIPANVQPAEGVAKGFSYVGGRLRLNVVAALEAGELQSRRDHTVASYRKVQTTLEGMIPRIQSILERSAKPAECASALEDVDSAGQTASCPETLDAAAWVPTVQTARKALSDFRGDADRRYLSVEARFDRGDLNADGAARRDTLLAAYVAGGYTFSPRSGRTSATLRARGGAVFFDDGMTTLSRTAGFAAIGVELGFTRDLRRYALSLGLELYSTQVKDDPALPVDHRNAFKIGVGVPVADGKTLSVGLTLPTDGGDSIVAVSGDWSLLLGSR